MCGIVGYAGPRPALRRAGRARRLEYRGYDSAGVAVIADDGGLRTAKKAGGLDNLERRARPSGTWPGTTGIGHTRWATHGGPTDRNAHPHTDSAGRVAVIHNGIIENFARLRAELEADGVEFAATPTPRWSPTCSAGAASCAAADRGATAGRGMRLVCRRLRGRVHPGAVHADHPGRGRRGPAQLAAGGRRRRRREVPRPATWPPSSSTPGRRSSSARTSWW